MNIAIIGSNGVVGKAVESGFRNKTTLYRVDPRLIGGSTIEEAVLECQFIFVSVPTPYNVKKKCLDESIISNVMIDINNSCIKLGKKPIVIVKSAVLPSIVRKWEGYSFDLVVSPEYLTERNSLHDFINQKVMVLGGQRESCFKVIELYRDYSICNNQCKVGICTQEEAALIKYMENSFLAMVNIFHNQFKLLYDKIFSGSFDKLLEVFYLDERMGVLPFVYTVPGPDGDYGFGGKCLPKDVNAIISEADNKGVSLSLLKEVLRVNNNIRSHKDWETIEGAFSEV